MFTHILELTRQALGFMPVIAPVPGAAIGAALATEIIKTCEDVSYQRTRARKIGDKSRTLANTLDESSSGKEVPSNLQARIDEAHGILKMTYKRACKWRERGRLTQWFYRSDMNKQMDYCEHELDKAINSFTLGNQVDMINGMEENRRQGEYHFAEMVELLLKIAQGQVDTQKMLQEVRIGNGDGDGVTTLLKNGQEALKEMRKNMKTSPSPTAKPSSSTNANKDPKSDQKYRDMQKGFSKLQNMAAILPPLKKLDGDVELIGDMAVASGSASDIWKGKWLGDKEVALKALRHVRVDDKTAQRRIVREIDIWSKLSNDHILQFYGYVTDLGPHLYLVSPWLKNGSVLDYIKEHPRVDRMHLLLGAAEGLRYLHSQEIIHGNIKCSNIMVSDSNEACISDFGMAKMIEEMTQTHLSTTIARSGSTRWLAPEIVNGDRPSKASDTYSFAMAVLELFTGKNPFAEHKSDAAVIRAVTLNHEVPKRPQSPDAGQLFTDGLWALLLKCWEKEPDSRPTMEEVVAALNK